MKLSRRLNRIHANIVRLACAAAGFFGVSFYGYYYFYFARSGFCSAP